MVWQELTDGVARELTVWHELTNNVARVIMWKEFASDVARVNRWCGKRVNSVARVNK